MVLWAFQLLHPYLEEDNFTIFTHYKALKWILGLADATGALADGDLAYQKLAVAGFDVLHGAKVTIQAADAFSQLETGGTDTIR